MMNNKKYIVLFSFIALNLALPTHALDRQWIKDHKALIIGGSTVTTLLVTTQLIIPSLIKNYNHSTLLAEQKRLSQQQKLLSILPSDLSTFTTRVVTEQENTLRNMWKTNMHIGLSLSFVGSYSGNRLKLAQCLHNDLYVAGRGIITRCIIANTTNLEGDFVIENSQLKNKVNLDKAASITIFKECVLDTIVASKEKTIIKLENSAVTGNIVFEGKEGTVLLDKKTILGGTIINGTAMYY